MADPDRFSRGPSARGLLRALVILHGACVICIAIALAIVLGALGEGALRFAMWLLLSAIAVTGAAWAWFALAVRYESRRGYTTLDGRLRHWVQLEPRTGRVSRPAGEPFGAGKWW